jgi:putative endonuclease
MKLLETKMTERMSWVVYILECSDGSLYTGITTDLARRITEHEQGNGARYTRGRGPFSLKYMEYCNNRAEASRREVSIKALSRAKKLELILPDNIAGLFFPHTR